MEKHKIIFILVPFFTEANKGFFTHPELDSLTNAGWLITETKDLLMDSTQTLPGDETGKVYQILLKRTEKQESVDPRKQVTLTGESTIERMKSN